MPLQIIFRNSALTGAATCSMLDTSVIRTDTSTRVHTETTVLMMWSSCITFTLVQVEPAHYFTINLYKLLLLANSLLTIYITWPLRFITGAVTIWWLNLFMRAVCLCEYGCLCVYVAQLVAEQRELISHMQKDTHRCRHTGSLINVLASVKIKV